MLLAQRHRTRRPRLRALADRAQASELGGQGVRVGSGFISSGGMGLTIGKQQQSADAQNQQTTAAASTVGSVGVSVQLGRGGVLKGDQVTAQVGGNLTIQSLQDSHQYQASHRSAGASVLLGAGASASLSLGQSQIDSAYSSVNQQSAIRAGDGGFAVDVAGNTTLTGGQITSTQAAIDQNQNRFQTGGTLASSDLQNTASYAASASGLTVGVGASLGASGAGVGADKGNASSVTVAAISGLAGHTEARTGDAQVGLAPIFDRDRVRTEVGAQVAITTAFGQQASKAIGRYGDQQLQNAADKKNRAAAEVDPVRRQALLDEAHALEDHWREGGTHRVALHTLAAGLGGGAAGALGAASSQTLIPQLGEAINALEAPAEFKQALTQGLAMGMGAAVGGAAGAASAHNATSQNYLTPRENLRRNRAQAE